MKMTDTDPEVRRELVDTVRRFITREVMPVASGGIHAAQMHQLLDLFGERGRHARSSVGVAELPMNIAVEVEMIVEAAP